MIRRDGWGPALSGSGEMSGADVPRTRPIRIYDRSAWKPGAGRASEVAEVGAESSGASSRGRSKDNASRARTEWLAGVASAYPGEPGALALAGEDSPKWSIGSRLRSLGRPAELTVGEQPATSTGPGQDIRSAKSDCR